MQSCSPASGKHALLHSQGFRSVCLIFQCPYHDPPNRGPSSCTQPAEPKLLQQPPGWISPRVHFSFPNLWFIRQGNPAMESLFPETRRDLRRAHLIQNLKSGKGGSTILLLRGSWSSEREHEVHFHSKGRRKAWNPGFLPAGARWDTCSCKVPLYTDLSAVSHDN